jgi:hypothetical protein
MDQTLFTQLANALDKEPGDILDVKAARDGGYNVVLTDYRKFRNVQPEPEREEKIPQEFIEPLINGDILPGTTIVLPEDLQAAYSKPNRTTVPVLKELCKLLGITVKKRSKKRDIVSLINDWKLQKAA